MRGKCGLSVRSKAVSYVGSRVRFAALGKEISPADAEYLIFLCGGLMTGHAAEIEKIGAFAKGNGLRAGNRRSNDSSFGRKRNSGDGCGAQPEL
jgi:hypothetical protein